MARVENDILKLRGSIGNLTFTQDENGTKVRLKPEKKEFTKLAPGSQKSALEMKGASKMAREFRRSFSRVDRMWMDHYFSGRLSGVLRRIAAEDNEQPAPRSLDIRRHGHLLEEFECIKKRPLWMSVGGLGQKPEWNAERTQAILTIPELNVKKQVTAPQDTNHIQFSFAVVPVANHVFDEKTQDYTAQEKVRDGCKIVQGSIISLKQKAIKNQRLELYWETSFPEGEALVAMVGVSFYLGMNGEFRAKGDTAAMRVLGVF